MARRSIPFEPLEKPQLPCLYSLVRHSEKSAHRLHTFSVYLRLADVLNLHQNAEVDLKALEARSFDRSELWRKYVVFVQEFLMQVIAMNGV